MLLEILKEPIRIDGQPMLKNVRLNLAPNRQFRLKLTHISDDIETPVDLVVYHWSPPKLDKLSISLNADGTELTTQVKFSLKFSYDFLKGVWKLRGKIGTRNISRDLSSLKELLEIVKEFVPNKK